MELEQSSTAFIPSPARSISYAISTADSVTRHV